MAGSNASPRSPVVLAGSSSAALGAAVAAPLGVSLGDVAIDRFPDGELHVEVREPVRGRSVYVVQSTGAPVGEALLELLLIADACRRAGARRVVALLPYLGLARQDRRQRDGEALGVRVVADVIAAGRFERAVTIDLHAPATEGCFEAPLDHVTAVPQLAEAARRVASGPCVVVAPDAGAARMAKQYARILGAPSARIEKSRRGAEDVEIAHVVGDDVAGRRPILVDDMISTGGTIEAALRAVLERGATEGAIVVATHLVPAAGGASRLAGLPIERVIATDSLAPPAEPLALERVSVGPLLAEVIARMEQGEGLGDLLGAR